MACMEEERQPTQDDKMAPKLDKVDNYLLHCQTACNLVKHALKYRIYMTA